jgi:hypothetical protein
MFLFCSHCQVKICGFGCGVVWSPLDSSSPAPTEFGVWGASPNPSSPGVSLA